MAIRSLQTFLELVKEFALSVNATLVRSNQNKVDVITRVPQRWLEMKNETEPVLQVWTTTGSEMEFSQIKKIYLHCKHPGVR